MPTRTEAIGNFLNKNTWSDLAALYNQNMEVQVNVAKGNGEKESGEYKGREFVVWTDGVQRWKSFRIPHNAGTNPTYTDRDMSFSLDLHAEGIGMTGWDWGNKVSRWVAYDFDSILGHSEKHQKKLSGPELDGIKQMVQDIPWIEVRKSTGGGGLHLYIPLEEIKTENHTEHAALARSILHMLTGLTGYEFATKVDVCGGNMWVWHRKKTKENCGLEIIKKSSQKLKLDMIPSNWKDHVKIVAGRAPRVKLQEIEDAGADLLSLFDQLTGQRSKVPLDTEHKKLIEWLTNHKAYWWWDNNMWMLVTHTTHLEDAHKDLNLRGKFTTLSKGANAGHDHNCFAYPLRNGGWVVRRYTPGTSESDTWQTDPNGWTRCFYNRDIDLPTACQMANGIEHPSGGYYFSEVLGLRKALVDLRLIPSDSENEIPNFITGSRHCIIKPGKSDNKITVTISFDDKDPAHPQANWILEKKLWKRSFTMISNESAEQVEKETYDDTVRHLITESAEDAGWVVKSGQEWRNEPLVHVKHALAAQGIATKDVNQIVGTQVVQAWKIVNIPFQPEYPGDRQWNRDAPQLAYTPSHYTDGLSFSTWNMIFDHCGTGLDIAVKDHPWCVKNNVLTGGDYLRLWVTSLIKFPLEPLPYLFLFSKEQNTGKSSLHIALSYLFTKGFMLANNALDGASAFNGEIANAILCVLEEINLNGKQGAQAYNKIKDWVTSPQILIHPKHITPYLRSNATHWIHCSNEHTYCPIFSGDTRITMIQVPPIPPEKLIVPRELENRLRNEAPDFLAYLLKVEIPFSGDRLRIPVVNTAEKEQAQENTKDSLQKFLDEFCYHVPGSCVTFSDFHELFHSKLELEERPIWTKIRAGKGLPLMYPKGRLSTSPHVHIGNIAFEKKDPVGPPFFLDDGVIRQGKTHVVSGTREPVQGSSTNNPTSTNSPATA